MISLTSISLFVKILCLAAGCIGGVWFLYWYQENAR